MEILIVILFTLVILLFYKVGKLNKHLVVLSFVERNINKLLVKKGTIKSSDIDIVMNESIGGMPENTGNTIIDYAKSIGVTIPKYMDEEELGKYLREQEQKKKNNEISFTDSMIMQD